MSHLDDDLLAVACVDENELSLEHRGHLSSCTLCRKAKEELAARLDLISELAESTVPVPFREVSLEADQTPHPLWWRPVFLPVLVSCSFLIIVAALWWSHSTIIPRSSVASVSEEMRRDRELLGEISLLVENPLPGSLILISPDEEPVLQEDFLEFIVPYAEDEYLDTEKT
ncbi:MAG: hypothetical protein ACP5G0_07400 [Desulfomonilia bacterium]